MLTLLTVNIYVNTKDTFSSAAFPKPSLGTYYIWKTCSWEMLARSFLGWVGTLSLQNFQGMFLGKCYQGLSLVAAAAAATAKKMNTALGPSP